jgi:peptide/nickel transport system permease protein
MSTVNDTRDATLGASAIPRRSSRGVWPRFRRHRLALIGLGILVVFSVMAILAPWVSINDPIRADVFNLKSAPSRDHILGTDSAGRDIFARIVHAGRVSLSVGIVAALISSAIGTIVGLVSGYVGGWVDNLLQRFTELVMTIPTFFALILLVSVLGASVWNLMAVIGALGWTGLERLVRGQVLSLREMDYVTAARAIGGSHGRLMFTHIFPGIVPYVAVAATLSLAGAILSEAGLSFLGLGIKIPTPTWGNMMTSGQSLHILENQPWLWLPPGIAISMTVIAVNFLGDGLRDALDPRTRIE